MNIIFTLLPVDLHIDADLNNVESYYHRKAARAVVRDADGKIALMYVASGDYYKLPGGGVDAGESIEEALTREMAEEIGCKVRVESEIGVVEETRSWDEMRQTSYAFLCHLDGSKGTPSFTQKELDEGFEVRWVANIDIAIELVASNEKNQRTLDNPDAYNAVFMSRRDAAILAAAKSSSLNHPRFRA